MKVGYARTSTVEQEAGFRAQIKELKAAGCQRTFREQTSSVGPRKELEAALDFVREGDSLTVLFAAQALFLAFLSVAACRNSKMAANKTVREPERWNQ